jgi:hypothetical protein
MGHHLIEFKFTDVSKHVPIYFIWGEKDPAFTSNTMDGVERRLKDLGYVTRSQQLMGIAHTEPDFALQASALEEVIEIANLTHPRLSDEERRAIWNGIAKRISDLSAIEDLPTRARSIDKMFHIPGLEQNKLPDYKKLVVVWFDTAFAQAMPVSDDYGRYEALERVAKHERTALVDAKRRKDLSTEMTKLAKVPAVKTEINAAAYLAHMEAEMAKVKGVPSKLKPLLDDLEKFIKRYPTSKANDRAVKLYESNAR